MTWMWLYMGLWGCGEQATAPPPPDEGGASVEVPAKPVARAEPLVMHPRPAEFSGKWLVIAGSVEGSQVAVGEKADEVRAALKDLGSLSMVRSSEFKNLSPCYTVLVVDAFADRDAAVARSRALTEAGVDNYPKQAGRWVGAQPGVEAYCEGQLDPPPTACPSGVRFMETWAGRHFVHLGLDEVLSERILEGAPTEKPLEPMRAWVSPLSHQVAGDYRLGQALEVYGTEGKQSCEITGFVSLVRGVPHFGVAEAGGGAEPSCGSSEVFAEVSCAGVVAGGAGYATGAPVSAEDAAAQAALAAVKAHPSWTEMQAYIGEVAQEEVSRTLHFRRYALGDQQWLSVGHHAITGEGLDMCGYEDLNDRRAAVVALDAEGKATVVTGMTRLVEGELETLGLVLDAAGQPGLLVEGWYRRWVVTPDGEDSCSVSIAFCDCAC